MSSRKATIAMKLVHYELAGLLSTSCYSAGILTCSELVTSGPRMTVQCDLNAKMLQKLKWLQ